MATIIPSIACLGIIGRNNNPLHITILPSHNSTAINSSLSSSISIPTNSYRQSSHQGTPPSSSTGGSAGAGAIVTGPLRTPLQFSLLLSSTLDVFELRARQNVSSGAGTVSGDLGLLCAVDERLACYGYETNTGVRFVAVVDMRGRLVDTEMPLSQQAPPQPQLPIKISPPHGNSDIEEGIHVLSSAAATQPQVFHENAIAIPAIPPFSGIGLLVSPNGSTSSLASSKKGAGAVASMASLVSASVGIRDAELKPLFRAVQTAWVRLLQNPFFELDEHVPPGGKGGRKITSKKLTEDMRKISAGWAPGVVAFEGF